jgi:hypothetical protein
MIGELSSAASVSQINQMTGSYVRKRNANLFLSEVTVQLLTFHAQHTENDTHLMCKPFTSEENYDIVPKRSLAKRHEKS